MDSDLEETAAVEACRSLACLTHTRAGTDPSRFKKYLKLPGRLGIYEIVGRISRMYKVMKVKPKVARKFELEDHDWCTTDQADVDWTSLACQDTKDLDVNPFSILIIKDSWLIQDKAAAEAGQSMFRGVSCCFGVPEVLAAYEVKDCRGALITMRRLSSASFGKNYIDRVLHREIIKTEGKDLREAATVQILLKAILHAMLGLYSRYLNGWIHGDVNISSVLLLAQPEMRRSDNLLCLTPGRRQLLGKCIGMLVDDSQGIEEGTLFDTMEEVLKPGMPGTLSFMSIRLLQSLLLPTRTVTTAIDDLESFIWVLCWTVFEICLGRRKLNICEEILRRYLHRTGDILMMAEDKKEYTVHLHGTVLPLGPSISSITPLVEKWYVLASTYQGKVKCLLAGISPSSDLSQVRHSLHEHCLEAFGKYLEEGFIMLDQLEDRHIPW
ncbi:hypothetical protein ARMGADRAFT_1080526 [Armillaria gallica]|uniref:Fungal-type protein kinase domain-containing protein n=1 Tax=Armillaria gallica TaxID=47427 RepID=A0A2H3DB43_ARMGA|nr:hypothetical protein ARMGADRAFT_1080526 [Armillaria gallica]